MTTTRTVTSFWRPIPGSDLSYKIVADLTDGLWYPCVFVGTRLEAGHIDDIDSWYFEQTVGPDPTEENLRTAITAYLEGTPRPEKSELF